MAADSATITHFIRGGRTVTALDTAVQTAFPGADTLRYRLSVNGAGSSYAIALRVLGAMKGGLARYEAELQTDTPFDFKIGQTATITAPHIFELPRRFFVNGVGPGEGKVTLQIIGKEL